MSEPCLESIACKCLGAGANTMNLAGKNSLCLGVGTSMSEPRWKAQHVNV